MYVFISNICLIMVGLIMREDSSREGNEHLMCKCSGLNVRGKSHTCTCTWNSNHSPNVLQSMLHPENVSEVAERLS